ncbi:MAG: hypothetical protein ACOCX5_04130 [Chloroflexota bacterium]
MLTVQLWRSLNRPLRRNPFYWQLNFRRQSSTRARTQPKRQTLRRNRLVVFLFFSLQILVVLFSLYILVALIFVLTFVPLLLFLAGNIMGVLLCINLSGIVAGYRSKGRLALLAVTPTGMDGILWLLLRVVYWRSRVLQQIKGIALTICILVSSVFAIFVVISLIALVLDPAYIGVSSAWPRLQLTVVIMVGLPLAIYSDLVQSSLLGGLLGITVPHYTRDIVSARVLSLGAFFTLQIVIYAIAVLAATRLLPAMLRMTDMEDLTVSTTIVGLIVLIVIRDLLLNGIWLVLGRLTGAQRRGLYLTLHGV